MTYKKTGQFFLVLAISTGWIFSGWPQILGFPPELQKALAAPPIPSYRSSGTFTAGTGVISPPYPTGMAANDICLLVLESENQSISLTLAQGFVEVTNSPQFAGTAATNPANRIAVFWKRTVGGDLAPTIVDSGNHTTGQIHCFFNVTTSGNPWDITAGGNDGGANDTTGVIPGATTATANTLVVLIQGTSNNATVTTNCSAWTNANLAALTEWTDNTNTAGLGGGHCMATGQKATAGAYADTTVTLSATTFKGAMSIALKPLAPTYNQSAYRLFNNNPTGSDIAANTVDTSTVGTATKLGYQRKTFWDSANSLWWTFYHNGTAIEYSNSSNGSTWTSRGTTGVSTNDFAVWYVPGSSTVYMVYLDSTLGVRVQKGTLAATSITWTQLTTVSSDTTGSVNISRDSDGKLWVVYRFSGTSVRTARSTSVDDVSAWDAEKIVFGGSASVQSFNPVVLPMTTARDMYFNYVVNNTVLPEETVRGKLWDDSLAAFGTEATAATITSSSPLGNESILSAVSSATDQVHVLYHNCTNAACTQGTINYARFSAGAWDTPVVLDSLTTNEYPTLSIDNTNSDNLYAFWIRANTIYYKKGVSPYASANWDTAGTSLVTTGTNSWLSSAYRDGNSQSVFEWTAGTVSPWNVNFYGKNTSSNSTDVGTALAAQDTAATLGSAGAAFRLRMLLHIGTDQLPASGENFKLQFAQQSGTCDTGFVGETYADVTAATVIAYKDNATPADGATLTANASDPTHSADTIVNQTYEELNNFTNSVAAIPSGQDGKWDFSLIDNGAPASTAYCFRAVKSDGTVLNTYTVIPQITTASFTPVYSVSITSSGTISYGFIQLSTASSTVGNGYTQTAQNDGNTAETLNVKSSDASNGTSWMLASNIGTNQFKHEFSTTTGSTWNVMPDSATYVTAKPSVAVSGTVDFDFRLTVPSATSDYQQKSITVTVQAVAP